MQNRWIKYLKITTTKVELDVLSRGDRKFNFIKQFFNVFVTDPHAQTIPCAPQTSHHQLKQKSQFYFMLEVGESEDGGRVLSPSLPVMDASNLFLSSRNVNRKSVMFI